MKKLCTTIVLGALTIGYMSAAKAQDTRESAVAGMRKVDPKEMDPAYNRTAPLAQKLVDDALAKHPEVILMAIHAGAPKYWVIASNFGRIGKLGDEDDLRCIRTGKTNLEVSPTGKHFEVEIPLQDRTGKTIGAVGVVFNYKPGDDKKAFEEIGEQIRAEMKPHIASAQSLFGPAN